MQVQGLALVLGLAEMTVCYPLEEYDGKPGAAYQSADRLLCAVSTALGYAALKHWQQIGSSQQCLCEAACKCIRP